MTGGKLIRFFLSIMCGCLLIDVSVAQSPPFRVIHRLESPSPNAGDFFGHEIVGVGDVIAISARDDDTFAEDGGAVYLFDQSGEFLRVIASPNAQEGGRFGYYMTAVGDDRLLVSASFEDEQAGNAYLFDLDGTLIKEFSSPNREAGAEFGGRFLLANDESLFIASYWDTSQGTEGGVVYKYDLDGQLISELVSPRAETGRCFGREGIFVGDDRILISDTCDRTSGKNEAGAAFLFDLEGNWLEAFDNPNPNDLDVFGTGLAYANGRILIGGAQIDDLNTGASTGAAYIFEPDGTLVTRVSDPNPRPGNWFGWNAGTLEKGGQELFLVGSIHNSTRVHRAGKAFLINSDGQFVQTLESPTPGPINKFGASFRQIGDRLLVAEKADDGGFPNGTGAVWVFEPADLGDFDLDGTVDEVDLEILCSDLVTGEITESWDITGDSTIGQQDLTKFLELTTFAQGDADLDGQVTITDFRTLSSNFGNPKATTWSEGNFDCSGHVEFSDFLLLSRNFGESRRAQSVPEPQGTWPVLAVLLPLIRSLRPRRLCVSNSGLSTHHSGADFRNAEAQRTQRIRADEVASRRGDELRLLL